MKNARYMMLTAIAASLVLSVAARADDPFDCDAGSSTIFDGDTDNDWTKATNWNNGVPDQGTDACIPDGETPQIIFEDEEEVRRLWIQTGGTVEIIGDDNQSKLSSLAVYGDSRIDGELVMISAPKLRINGPRTFDGTGKLILLAEFNRTYPKIVENNWPYSSLTLSGACAVSCTPDQWDDSGTLVLMGGGLIDVPLTNNAHVTTWNDELFSIADSTLTIAKTAGGNGFWIAERNDQLTYDKAILDVTETVTGAGTWVVAGHDTASLRFNEACTNLTGDVLVYDGRVLVNQNFETAGDLTFEDAGSDPTEIRVDEGKTAKFSVQ